MCRDNKENYKSMMNQISTPDELRESMLERASAESRRRKIGISKKAVAIPAAACFTAACALTVAAASDSDFFSNALKKLTGRDDSEIERFVEVDKSCTDNGIKLDVISANVYDNTAEIFISVQDTEGNRIDRDTNLLDNCTLYVDGEKVYTCGAGGAWDEEGYDAQAGVSCFYLSFTTDDYDLKDKSLTLSVDGMTNGTSVNRAEIINSDSIENVENFATVTVDGDERKIPVPVSEGRVTVDDNAVVCAVGYVDGKLHILTEMNYSVVCPEQEEFYNIELNKSSNDSIMEFSCDSVEIDGKDIDSDAFSDDKIYLDEIIDPNDNDGFTVVASYIKPENTVEGNWEVSFTADSEQGSYVQ